MIAGHVNGANSKRWKWRRKTWREREKTKSNWVGEWGRRKILEDERKVPSWRCLRHDFTFPDLGLALGERGLTGLPRKNLSHSSSDPRLETGETGMVIWSLSRSRPPPLFLVSAGPNPRPAPAPITKVPRTTGDSVSLFEPEAVALEFPLVVSEGRTSRFRDRLLMVDMGLPQRELSCPKGLWP